MTTCWIYRRVQLLVCVFTYLLVSFAAVRDRSFFSRSLIFLDALPPFKAVFFGGDHPPNPTSPPPYLVKNERSLIRVVMQCSSPTNGCSLELCIPFPLSLRTNNMHVTVSSCTNHISRYICRQRSRFPRNGSLFLIGQFKERNAELE